MVTVPFDSRTFNDIIDYLKSKLNLENSIDDEKTFFKSKLKVTWILYKIHKK